MSEQKDLDLGTAIDKLYELRAERLAIEKQIKELKTKELEMRVTIKRLLDAASLEGGRGQIATASIRYSTEPTVKDWPAFYEFVRTNDAFDLLQKRVSSTAIKERWDAEVVVPGIEKFDTWDISLTKRSK